jgi:GTP pyrophosphokinase
LGLNEPKLLRGEAYEAFARERGIKGEGHLFALIGYGRISPHQLLTALLPNEKLQEPEGGQPKKPSALGRLFRKAFERPSGAVRVGGYDDLLVTLGKCCNPIPGDNIIGFITRGRGVTIHSTNCSKVLASDQERRVDASWNLKAKRPTATKIRVVCVDKPGLLADISQSISTEGANINQATCRSIGDQKSMNTFEVEIKNLTHLHQLMKSLEKVKGVISVERVRD